MTPERRTRTNIHAFSARKEAFLYFERGMDPSWVSVLNGLSLATTRRYYTSWKKLPHGLNQNLATARATWRRMTEKERMSLAKALSDERLCTPQAILERIRRPWALRDLLTGKWRHWDVVGGKNRTSGTSFLTHSLQKLRQPACVKLMLELISWGPDKPEGQAPEEKKQIR